MKVRECVLIVVGPHLIAPSILAGLSCVSKVDYVHCLSVSVINKLSCLHQIVAGEGGQS